MPRPVCPAVPVTILLYQHVRRLDADPSSSKRDKRDAVIGSWSADFIRACGQISAASRAEYMTAPDQLVSTHDIPCKPGSVHTWNWRPSGEITDRRAFPRRLRIWSRRSGILCFPRVESAACHVSPRHPATRRDTRPSPRRSPTVRPRCRWPRQRHRAALRRGRRPPAPSSRSAPRAGSAFPGRAAGR